MSEITPILSLIIEPSNVIFPDTLTNAELIAFFNPKAIEVFKQNMFVITYFGLVPDNGADGIDELLIDGLLFRFDVPQTVLGINLNAAPNVVHAAYKAIVDNTIPSNCFILEETGATKKETTLVFEFLNL